MGCGAIIAITTCCFFGVAITCCCMQFLGVACNFPLLTQDPAAPPPSSQQQHYPRTNTSSSSSKPIPFPTETTTTTDRRALYGYAHCTSYVAIVKASKFVPQERIADRICEHVVDVSVPQVVEQLIVVPKIPSQTESRSVPWNRFLAVPVPRMIEQLVEVPKFVSQDRIRQRTLEQISDTPVPQVVEELVGLHSFLPGWGSASFCGADLRNSRDFTR